jgi:uncharacterized membrane protein
MWKLDEVTIHDMKILVRFYLIVIILSIPGYVSLFLIGWLGTLLCGISIILLLFFIMLTVYFTYIESKINSKKVK